MGDIVILRGDAKLGREPFRLAKVLECHPDEQGITRTVSILLRNRRRARPGPGEVMRMAVQRLSILLPVEEQWEAGVSMQ